MNALAASRLAHWWIHGLNASPGARPVANEFNTRAATLVATRAQRPTTTVASQWLSIVQHWLRQMLPPQGPQNAEELLAYARSIENEMPSLASDLRYAAMRHADAANEGQ